MTEHVGVAGGHELIHWAAALVLVVGGAAFLILSALARRRHRRVVAAEPDSHAEAVIAGTSGHGLLGPTMAGLSLGAGVIHLAAAPHHYAELGDLGAGFVAAGIFQVAWARQALRGLDGGAESRALRIGLVGNLGIIAAWLVARTVGLPVGSIEPVGLADGAATAFEALIVVGLGGILVAPLRSRLAAVRRVPAVASVAAVAVVPLLGVVLLVTSLATVAIAAGADHGRPADGLPAPGLPDHAGHGTAAELRTAPDAP